MALSSIFRDITKEVQMPYLSIVKALLILLLFAQMPVTGQHNCIAIVNGPKGRSIINMQGDILFQVSFSDSHLRNGMVAYIPSDSGWVYYNIEQQKVIPGTFSEPRPFTNGYAAVRKAKQWGLIDKKGNYLVPPRYKTVSDVDDWGIAIVIDSMDRLAIIDTAGNFVLPFRYKWYEHLTSEDGEPSRFPRFDEGLIAVIDTSIQIKRFAKGGLIFIDHNGRKRLGPYIPNFSFVPTYQEPRLPSLADNCKCNRFANGFALLNIDNDFITINQNGDTIFQGFSEPLQEEFFLQHRSTGYYHGYHYSDRTAGCEELRYIHPFGLKIFVGSRKCRNQNSNSVKIYNRYGRHIYTSFGTLLVNNGMAIHSTCTRTRGKPAFDGQNNCARYLHLVIDTAGKVIFRKHTSKAAITFNGDKVQVKQGKKIYYIDRYGRKTQAAAKSAAYKPINDKLSQAGVQWVGKFHCGLAPFQMNYKFGYINEKEEIVIPAIYESAGEFMSIE